MITSFTIDAIGVGVWRLSFASDSVSPTFYVYRDGALMGTTLLGTWIVPDLVGSVYEVLDTAASPQTGYPPYAMLTWYAASDDVDHYLVEQYVDGNWATKAEIPAIGETYYKWASTALDDVTTHQFRITPVGENGNDGTAQTFSVLMVRYPSSPEVDMAYNGSGTPTVTIS